MEFFERLKERARLKWKEDYGLPYLDDFGADITPMVETTIEALKEMMVHGPKKGIIRHRPWYVNMGLSTDIDMTYLMGNPMIPWHIDKHGTDGEEVVVMVFSQGGKEE